MRSFILGRITCLLEAYSNVSGRAACCSSFEASHLCREVKCITQAGVMGPYSTHYRAVVMGQNKLCPLGAQDVRVRWEGALMETGVRGGWGWISTQTSPIRLGGEPSRLNFCLQTPRGTAFTKLWQEGDKGQCPWWVQPGASSVILSVN